MAGRIAGITIEIGGDTSNLQKSLKGVDSQLRKTQSNLKDVNKLLKLDPGNTELLVQKQKNLEKAIGDTKTRLQELKDAQNGVAKGSDEWDALQREIIATQQDLQSLENEYTSFGSVAAQKVAVAGQSLQELGGKIEGVGNKLKPLSTAAAGLLTSLAGLGYSAITSSDDLNTLAKQTGLSTAEIQKMQYAADMIDVSFSDIEGALKKLKPKLTENNATFQELGIAVTDADGNLRSTTEVFYEAVQALSHIENETERDQVAMELFGKSADSLAGIIDDGGAALRQYGKDAEDLGLILDQETLDSLNSLNDTIDVLKANFTGAFAKLGSTVALQFGPYLQKAAEYAQQLADKIANLSPETVSLIAKIAGVVAVLAPMTIGIGKATQGVGKVLTTVPKVVGTLKKVGTAIKGVTALLSPQILIIGAVVAAVVAAAVLIYKNWDKIKAWTQAMAKTVNAAWDNLKASISKTVTAIKTSVTSAWTNLKTAVTTAATNIKTAVTEAWEKTKTAVSVTMTALKSAISTAWASLKTDVEGKVNALKSGVSTAWEGLKTAVSTSVTNLKTAVSTAWENLKSSVQTAADTIKTGASSAFETLKTSITDKVDSLKSSVSTAWTNLKSAVTDTASSLVDSITGFFDKLDIKIPEIKIPTWEDIKQKFENIKTEINKWLAKFVPKINLKIPKISIDGGEAPWGIGGKGKKPSFSVKWEKKAYENPVMFTRPTVLATPNGNYGFGDGHGAEIVLGLNKLRELVGSTGGTTINIYPAPGANVEQIAQAVEQKLVAAQQRRMRVYA